MPHTHVKTWIFMLFLLQVALCAAQDGTPTIEQLFQSPENQQFIREPDRVEACQLVAKQPWYTKNLSKRKYREGKYGVVPPDSVVILQEKLLSNDTYLWEAAKACRPLYNVRVRFVRGREHLDVDFCFSCEILLLSRNGRPFSGQNFDHAADAFLEVMAIQFPHDAYIQGELNARELEKKWDAELSRHTDPAVRARISAEKARAMAEPNSVLPGK